MSSEHFSVDGTLIQAWASMKSFRPKTEKDDSHLHLTPAPRRLGEGHEGV